MHMKTVIMAGGKGTRIAELFPDLPKPLIPIEDNKEKSRRDLVCYVAESLYLQDF